MRKKNQKQMPLNPANVKHPHAKILEAMSRFLDDNPILKFHGFCGYVGAPRGLMVSGRDGEGQKQNNSMISAT